MPREITVFGALMPTLMLVLIVAFIVQIGIDWLMSHLHLYRYVWHPGLFRVALFFCIFSSCGLLLHAV
ncbi:DUF1656 domain-containing protein [Glaciimonas soli]|uniref:DUF1656 domain-containing protein n=1 Tax=Glaciimonas soli TaxID=2590999 RepID=A0A843YXK3_9BURK|nr:DUF1656 domain-containing protein [Glaciimonas soli]MQR02394.1 DUF1656 domain-containing protein [Glaciimonas soli]